VIDCCSLGGDLDFLLRLGFLHLWNNNRQDAILHAGLDIIMVNRIWEGEAAGKFANAAFRDPIGMLGFVFRDIFASGGSHFGARGGLSLLTGFLFATGIDLTCLLGGSTAFFSELLSPALDGDGLFVGKRNDDIFLVNAREFAFENVVVFGFLDVELWCEGTRGRVGQLLKFGEGVIEEVEERTHLGAVGSE